MSTKTILGCLFPATVVGIFQALFLSAVDAQVETVTVEQNNTTQNSTNSGNGDSSESSAVVIAIVVTLFVLVAVLVAIFIIRKRRQSQMMDKEKKMQIQMSSARNAGVYQDLTVSVPAEEKPPASPEHEKLNAAHEA